ncbi:F-box domain-containing protein [Caenorhabditis elegans]|uniref:F-box domain-containing protein n=1 Tax=Caenorhabditis elegans TaxID=6239 RepID=Q4TTB2_CAEEL|nr:F-box domain-containing protein [Caenorhabditis elegans]CCD69229.2 F-box domain-containing protein [Caenorhabditis elegans]|eukprot:NP_001022311.2 Uncharacterized protein CELE_T05A7.11 [Caenorhabditis elegans]
MSDPMEKIFSIDIVINNIIKHTYPFENFPDLRLVNRSFNKECINVLRQSHEKILIEARVPEVHLKPDDEGVTINGKFCKESSFHKRIRFLKNKCRVKIKYFEVKELHKLKHWDLQNTHRIIMDDLIGNCRYTIREFIGMSSICPEGCEGCTEIADKCNRYGPLQLHMVIRSRLDPHFKELIICDRLFSLIEQHKRRQYASYLQNLIPPFTCDHLILILNSSFSRDVAMELLAALNPKTVELRVGRFGAIRLHEAQHAPVNNWNLSHLHINMRNSEWLSKEDCAVTIHNASCLFPTEKLKISLPSCLVNLASMERNVIDLIPLIWRNVPKYIKIDLHLFPTVPKTTQTVKFFKNLRIENGQTVKWLRLEEKSREERRSANFLRLPEGPYMDMYFTIKDKSINRMLDIAVLVEEESFGKYYHSTINQKEYSASARKFITPEHVANCTRCYRHHGVNKSKSKWEFA